MRTATLFRPKWHISLKYAYFHLSWKRWPSLSSFLFLSLLLAFQKWARNSYRKVSRQRCQAPVYHNLANHNQEIIHTFFGKCWRACNIDFIKGWRFECEPHSARGPDFGHACPRHYSRCKRLCQMCRSELLMCKKRVSSLSCHYEVNSSSREMDFF